VRLAHQFAMENDLIQADMVEATEFPDLSTHYQVYAVPKTVINDRASLEGSAPEDQLLEAILAAIQQQSAGTPS
jgi:predicted DsbA family dithiol-disulfide isomerase